MIARLASTLLVAALAAPGQPLAQVAGPAAAGKAIDLVSLPTPNSPLVAIRLMFRVGSIDDPKGKEGLASLTALMVGSSGTAKRTYPQLVEAMYPLAASISVLTDREVTVFGTQVNRDTLKDVTALLQEVLLEPGFREEDFTRHRDQLMAYLTTTLRSANDELLGLEMIQQVIYRGHRYEHSPAGTVEGLKGITLDDVRRFYREHYTQANLILGVAGGFTSEFPESLASALRKLPAGGAARPALPAPATVKGRHVTIVDKKTDSTGIHFGFALPITRASDDFYPLLVANSLLGEHRTFHGRLMNELRGKRGLNYGDYSYIEFWANPPGTSNPPPNHPRRQQYFSVWIRPVVPANAPFALRAGLSEVNRLVEKGLTKEEFELTREFLISYSKLWARSLSDRLAFHMDSRYYGTPYYIDEIERRLARLTVEDVNRALRKYLQTENLQAVIVSGEASALRERLTSDKPSPITYANPVPPEVTEADKAIGGLPIRAADISVLPVDRAFASVGTSSSAGQEADTVTSAPPAQAWVAEEMQKRASAVAKARGFTRHATPRAARSAGTRAGHTLRGPRVP